MVIREFRIVPRINRQLLFVEAVDQDDGVVDSVAAAAVAIAPPVSFQASVRSLILAADGVGYLNNFGTPRVFLQTSIEQTQLFDWKDST